MKQPHHRFDRRGFTLLLAALFASIAATLGASIFDIVSKEIQLSSISRNSELAFYTADTAAECALYWDARFAKFSNPPASPSCDRANPNYYGITCGGQDACITATNVQSASGLSIDAENAVDGGTSPDPTQPSITLSTSKTNDVIIVSIANGTNDGPNPPAKIASMTDTAGLTWHRRFIKTINSFVGDNWNGNTTPVGYDYEMWWARAPQTLAGDVIQPSFVGGTIDVSSLIALAVSGADVNNPWDTNISLPAFAVNKSATYLGGTDADPSVSVSTDADSVMLLGFMTTPYFGVDDNAARTSPGPGIPGTNIPYDAGPGFTLLSYIQGQTNHSESDSGAEYQIVSSPQSNATVSFTPAGQGWIMEGDAIRSAAVGCAQGSCLTTGTYTFEFSQSSVTCADVTVTKSYNNTNSSIDTAIRGDGFNVPCSAISTDPTTLQRSVEYIN